MIGDTYRIVNAYLECLAAGQSGGDCVLGASKAPMIFKSLQYELCHIRARLDYLNAFLDCLEAPDPGECCQKAYEQYCHAAEVCDAC